MDWTIIEKITNHPVFVALAVIVPILIGAVSIFQKSSLGKKAIEKITSLVDKNACRVIDIKKEVENIGDTVKLVKEDVTDFKVQVVNEVKTYFGQLEFFEKSIFDILSQIPNAKVQDQLKLFYAQWQNKKREIQEYVGGSFTEIDEKLKEIEDAKNREIDSLKSEMEKLKESITKLTNALENGENEEKNTGTDN